MKETGFQKGQSDKKQAAKASFTPLDIKLENARQRPRPKETERPSQLLSR